MHFCIDLLHEMAYIKDMHSNGIGTKSKGYG